LTSINLQCCDIKTVC